jgi:HD-GYP domain-containing protein (c-di-GMP phosphodiesterase class II)
MKLDLPYRKALMEEVAIRELKEESGTQFDPKIVEAFLEILKTKS